MQTSSPSGMSRRARTTHQARVASTAAFGQQEWLKRAAATKSATRWGSRLHSCTLFSSIRVSLGCPSPLAPTARERTLSLKNSLSLCRWQSLNMSLWAEGPSWPEQKAVSKRTAQPLPMGFAARYPLPLPGTSTSSSRPSTISEWVPAASLDDSPALSSGAAPAARPCSATWSSKRRPASRHPPRCRTTSSGGWPPRAGPSRGRAAGAPSATGEGSRFSTRTFTSPPLARRHFHRDFSGS
mmetsp:Transcript_111978/g.317049  ORF Transcript_111978/g.317049 Transcript_111978/m.317049 type:complete len:240 (-) Transcript_111978:177-896(-)